MADPDEWDQESGQLDAEDTLDDRGVADPLDEGISPPERPWIGDGWGVTAREQAQGEAVDGCWPVRCPTSCPTRATGSATPPTPTASRGTTRSAPAGRPARRRRPGRRPDVDDELWARDIGVDGAGASAEEAAMHVVGDRSPPTTTDPADDWSRPHTSAYDPVGPASLAYAPPHDGRG